MLLALQDINLKLFFASVFPFQREYLIRWKGYSSLADSWEIEENLNENVLRAFRYFKPSPERI